MNTMLMTTKSTSKESSISKDIPKENIIPFKKGKIEGTYSLKIPENYWGQVRVKLQLMENIVVNSISMKSQVLDVDIDVTKEIGYGESKKYEILSNNHPVSNFSVRIHFLNRGECYIAFYVNSIKMFSESIVQQFIADNIVFYYPYEFRVPETDTTRFGPYALYSGETKTINVQAINTAIKGTTTTCGTSEVGTASKDFYQFTGMLYFHMADGKGQNKNKSFFAFENGVLIASSVYYFNTDFNPKNTLGMYCPKTKAAYKVAFLLSFDILPLIIDLLFINQGEVSIYDTNIKLNNPWLANGNGVYKPVDLHFLGHILQEYGSWKDA